MDKHNRLGALLIVGGVLIFLFATFFTIVLPALLKQPTNIWLGDGVFRTKLALTDITRTKGLSGTKEITADEALLMVFPSEGKWGIWMKDMNFPIDIVWLNKNKKVIYIVKNAPPSDSTATVFAPNNPAKYIVELPAGTVDSKSITTNSLAIFQINPGEVN